MQVEGVSASLVKRGAGRYMRAMSPVAPSRLNRRLKLLAEPRPGALFVHEVYRSLQGESTRAGLPCTFVRLSVCDLRCSWCDTPHAFQEGAWRSTEEVLEEVRRLGCPMVEVTGGEPLLQAEVHGLMRTLADEGYEVLLETSGAADVSPVDPRVRIIMDLKCPDSGECGRNRFENLDVLAPHSEIKFVIASRRDFDWAVETIRSWRLQTRFEVLFSAAWGRVELADLSAWLLASGLRARLQLQMHKFIWDPKATGV